VTDEVDLEGKAEHERLEKLARKVINAGDGFKWRLVPLLAGEPGKPVAVLPIGHDFVANRGYIKVSDDRNTTPQNPAKNGPFEHPYFGWPLEMQATEIGGRNLLKPRTLHRTLFRLPDPTIQGVVGQNRPPRKNYERR
jgi:hypothetical protein